MSQFGKPTSCALLRLSQFGKVTLNESTSTDSHLTVLHAFRPVNELKKVTSVDLALGQHMLLLWIMKKKESTNTRCIHFLLPQNVKLTHYMTQSIGRHVQSSSTWVCMVTLMFTSYWRIGIHVQKLHAHRVNRRHYLHEPTQWNSSHVRLYIQQLRFEKFTNPLRNDAFATSLHSNIVTLSKFRF